MAKAKKESPADSNEQLPTEQAEKKSERGAKSKAIREVLASGIEKPQEVVLQVKERYGLDVSAQAVSQIKSKLREGDVKPTHSGPTSKAALLTELLEAAKKLKAELGAEEAKRFIDLL